MALSLHRWPEGLSRLALGGLLLLLVQLASSPSEGVRQVLLTACWVLALVHLVMAALPPRRPSSPPEPAPLDDEVGFIDEALFTVRAGPLLTNSAKSSEGVAVFLLELEHRERLRDLLGEAAVADAERIVTNVLADLLRGADLKTRLANGRYVSLLTGMTLAKATEIAERLKAAVETGLLVREGRLLPVRAALGVAVAGHPVALDDLLETAASALRRGRNSGPGLHLIRLDGSAV